MERTLILLHRLHRKRGLERHHTQQVGAEGERAAYFHLRRRGYTVVARRWRHALLDGEVDLIAWDGETLCFVEVKTRSERTPFAAEFAVDEAKQKVLRRMAEAYVRRLPWPDQQPRDLATRFDVVSVYVASDGQADVRLQRDYFR